MRGVRGISWLSRELILGRAKTLGPSRPIHRLYSRMRHQYTLDHFEDNGFERLEGYMPGGYHPIMIGDSFCNGRYLVVHKLGFGSYSTVWLARDEVLRRHVSLKVLMAQDSAETREAAIINKLQQSDHVGRRFVPVVLDQFGFDGPNGHHVCLVSEIAGCNLAMSKNLSPDEIFPGETARSIAAQCLIALAHLHANGVCHGDLRMPNMLLRDDELGTTSTVGLYKRFGQPNATPVERLDGGAVEPNAPPLAVEQLYNGTPAHKLRDPEILICDYGTSFLVKQTPSPTLCTPIAYSPPEFLFGEPLVRPMAADVWTLGITLFFLLGRNPPFVVCISGDYDEAIEGIIRTLGPLPERWWQSAFCHPRFFTPDRKSRVASPQYLASRTSEPLLEQLLEINRETFRWDVLGGELDALHQLFRAMLTLDPSKRANADQLLCSEYMTKWAMPAWERQTLRMRDRRFLGQGHGQPEANPTDTLGPLTGIVLEASLEQYLGGPRVEREDADDAWVEEYEPQLCLPLPIKPLLALPLPNR
ncbi:hypothetical protein G6O67_003591 [Ophiocordyceps sinensis]|uniref:non-specific serine/threonine protein kinase n=2 Tax=Ophiocordyceps sinensis TaxID=72228 RepID=A0A8H4PS29_9HYPO|nr:protein kinase domain-containing protein [Ophiocordyceps sinensis CO18]KAF4509415.1 hypothetical protein G6O67_003591 [Ophiocordyceps sinensis]